MRRRLNDLARVGERCIIFLRERIVRAAAYLWRRLMFRTTFVAITGSVGKTTTKDLISATLAGIPAPVVSNFASQNSVGQVARTLLRVRPWHRFAVLEVASGRPGQIALGARIASPHIAVILSVARTHTNKFHTLEDTAAEKASLLRFLRKGGVAILNADDPYVAGMVPPPSRRVVRFGCGADADVRAEDFGGPWPERLSFSVSRKSGDSTAATERIQSQLVGTHWTAAILATVAVGLECGMSSRHVASVITQTPPTLGRMSPAILPNGAVILRDEFNGSLDTYQAAFEVLRVAKSQRKILVVTTVTDAPEGWNKRTRRIASEAAGVVDVLVLIGGRTYTEKSSQGALKAGMAPEAVHCIDDLRDVAAFLRSELRAGDLVLLRGKTEHHLTRLFYAQLREVACWKETCPKRILCDHCPELLASGEYLRGGVSG